MAMEACSIQTKKRKISTAHARRRARALSSTAKTGMLSGGQTDSGSHSISSIGSTYSLNHTRTEFKTEVDAGIRDRYENHRANACWITTKFKRKECVRYVEDQTTPRLCSCGRMENQHYLPTILEEEGDDGQGAEVCQEEVEGGGGNMAQGLPPLLERSGYPLTPTCINNTRHQVKAWSSKDDIKEFPTNAFGEIKFTNAYKKNVKSAKYVRMSDNTKVEIIVELLVKQWKLVKPDVVISIHGGLKNFKLDPLHKEIFSRGLIRAAKTTSNGAWIITGGTNLGVMRAVGQAVQEGQSMQWGGLASHRSIRCIGVATWGYVDRNEYLVNVQEGQGCYPATYRVEHTFQRRKPVSLNPHHTHFILVDDGTEGQCGTKELRLRARLEKAIAEKPNIQTNRFGLGVPVVIVVVEGGEDALKAVQESLLCGMPALVVEGTGRTADILGFAYSNCETIDGKRQVKRDELPRVIAKIKEANPGKYDDPDKEPLLMKQVDIVNDCMKDERLITVYRINAKERLDLDLAILSALLKGQGASKEDQLRLALTWDRVDIAEEKIFTADTDWPHGSLDRVMMEALKQGRVEFVRLFLANGVSMRDFLTVPRLRQLYNSAEPGSHLYSLMTTVADCPEGSYSLKDIGCLIEELVGAHYEPLYLKDTHCTGTLAAQAISLFGAVRGGDPEHDEVDFLPSAKMETGHKVGKTRVTGAPTHFEKPFRELFLWAVLMNRFELAKFMWEKEEESVSDALAACRLFRAIHNNIEDEFFEMKTGLLDHAAQFESMAVGVLDECFGEDEVLAEMLVEREFPNWGGMSVLNLAAKARAQRFLAHPCCQSCLNNIWKSRGMPGVENWQVMMTLLLPFLLLTSQILFYDDEKHSWQVSLWRKFDIFYTAPISKLWANLGMYVIFLGLYAYVILFSIEKSGPSVYEIILICWIFSMIADEIRQVIWQESSTLKGKLEQHFATRVNIVDLVANGVAVTAFIMRFFNPTWEAARVLYCTDFVIYAFRLFRVYFVSGYLGPKLVMIERMLSDVFMWACLLIVFVMSYGVFRQALFFGNKEPYWDVINDIFKKPYWHIYGELFFDQDDNSDKLITGEVPLHSGVHIVWIDRILMAGYLLITNVLLINLLIAIFSNVFNEVEANAYQIWKYKYYFLVMEYSKQSPLTPPFVIVSHLIEMAYWLVGKCCKPGKVTPQFTPEDLEILRLFEIECTANFQRKKEEQLNACTEARIRKIGDRMESLVKQVSTLQGELHKHLEERQQTAL